MSLNINILVTLACGWCWYEMVHIGLTMSLSVEQAGEHNALLVSLGLTSSIAAMSCDGFLPLRGGMTKRDSDLWKSVN
jgi:hypothetical protein